MRHLVAAPLRFFLAACGGLLLLAAAPAQSVLVVDAAGGPGVFADIQPAVDAAAAGDTIVVRAGSYGAFSIPDKPLQVVADRGAAARVAGSMRVAGLSAGRTVVLRGLSVLPPVGGDGAIVQSCLGDVWLEDCRIFGTVSPAGHVGGGGLVVEDSRAVVVTRCAITGGGTPGWSIPAAAGAAVRRSTLLAFDSAILGGSGIPPATGQTLSPGGVGLRVQDSTVHAQRTSLVGGRGGEGPGLFGACQNGENGGAGALVTGASSELELLSSTTAGGAGGTAAPPCTPGAPGAPTELTAGRVVPVGGPGVGLSVNSPVRGGETAKFSLTGASGNAVGLWLATAASPLRLAAVRGALLVELSTVVPLALGALPAGGALDVSFTLPSLPAGVEVVTLFAQVVAVDPGQGAAAGGGQVLSWIALP